MGGALKVTRVICERCEDKESDGCDSCIVKLAYDAEDERLAKLYKVECGAIGRIFRAAYTRKRCMEIKQGRKRY